MKALVLTALLLIGIQTGTSHKQGDMVQVTGQNAIQLARVIAIPGDKVRVDSSGVFVNDMRVSWVTAEVIRNLPKPWHPEVVDKYLVASGAPPTNPSFSGKWAYVGADQLADAKP
jgi:hypothetical protein